MKLHVLSLVAVLETAHAEMPRAIHSEEGITTHRPALYDKAPDTHQEPLKQKLKTLIDALDAHRKDGKPLDLGAMEKALRDFYTRLEKGTPSLSEKETDRVEILTNFASEILDLRKANASAQLKDLKKLALSNYIKRMRLSLKNVTEMSAKVKQKFDALKKYVSDNVEDRDVEDISDEVPQELKKRVEEYRTARLAQKRSHNFGSLAD